MSDALLKLDELRVDYDRVCAVRDLSLELCVGDVFGLVGPNGAGKTTTLCAAAGLLEPTYGHIRIAGYDLHEQPRAAKRCIGFMPDYSPAYDDLTVWEYLELYAGAYDLPSDRRPKRIEECIGMAWLGEKRHAMVGSLSRGMKQRLMLARTLLHDPAVLLMDEPASGLDPRGRLELRNVLVALRTAGKAILISSHILSEMSEFCNRMGIMERGRLIRSGSVTELAGHLPSAQRYLARSLNGRDSLEAVLRAEPQVVGIGYRNGSVWFDWSGSESEAADLLRRLVTANLTVVEFRPHEIDMEDIFLNSDVKELS